MRIFNNSTLYYSTLSIDKLKILVDNNDLIACFKLSLKLLENIDKFQNKENGLELLKRCIEINNLEELNLSYSYESKINDSYLIARDCLFQIYNLGHKNVSIGIAYLYFKGIVEPKNLQKAIYYLEESITLESDDALFLKAIILNLNSKYKLKSDLPINEAREILLSNEKFDNPTNHFFLDVELLYNPKKSIKILLLLSNKGHIHSIIELTNIFIEGRNKFIKQHIIYDLLLKYKNSSNDINSSLKELYYYDCFNNNSNHIYLNNVLIDICETSYRNKTLQSITKEDTYNQNTIITTLLLFKKMNILTTDKIFNITTLISINDAKKIINTYCTKYN